MADYFDVGAGKTYSGVNGFIDALNAIPSDFTSVTGDQIIRIWPDFIYNLPSGGPRNILITNTGPSKKLKIQPAEGYEHDGIFGAGVILQYNSTGSAYSQQTGFIINTPYFEFSDIQIVLGSLSNARVIVFNIYEQNCKIQNVLLEDNSGVLTGSDARYLSVWRSGSSGIQNNCIYFGELPGSRVVFYAEPPTAVVEVNNNIGYGALYDFANSPLIIANNNGAISAGGFYGISGVTMSGNYTTDGSVGGSNALTLTLAQCGFIDLPNKDFRLKTNSPLINTGSLNSINNPKSISGETWNSNHRSPYNNTVLFNTFMQPPEDIDHINGNWSNGILLNLINPGNKVLAGSEKQLTNCDGQFYSHAGYVTKNYTGYYYTIDRNFSSKKMTISAIFKGPSGGVLNILASGQNGLYIPSSTEIGFFSNNGTTFTAKVTPSSVISTQDYYSIILSVDLEKPTNEEKIKIYLFQKGALHRPIITFSGAAPSFIVGSEWIVYNQDTQGVTSMWDRTLSFEEIYNIAYDPYVIYRDDKKKLRLLNIIQGQDNLFFFRKFIMEK